MSAPAVEATYLRFGLRISERRVEITSPEGRYVDTVRSLSTARRVVRGYRKAA